MTHIKSITIIYFLAFLILPFIGQAQKNRASDSKIEARRAAYISERLDLSVKEAEVFFPIYNEYNDKLKALRKENKEDVSWDDLTEDQAKNRIEKNLDLENRKIGIKRAYITQMSSAISHKKILQLFRAEHEFKKEVLQRLRKRRNADR